MEFCSCCSICICKNQNVFSDGLPQNPKTTDCFCLIMYLIFMAFVVYGMIYGVTHGNVKNIGQPYDSEGNFKIF